MPRLQAVPHRPRVVIAGAGIAGVYAGGDATAQPVMQGGPATQQADAAAAVWLAGVLTPGLARLRERREAAQRA
jgi:hypothetical protein